MMKNQLKYLVASTLTAFLNHASAGGISSTLDGMFANVTAPNVVSNQFRGAISGGGVYIRSPITSINLISMDPPRFSAGCGGIDAFSGSFSWISSDKLTQFIRSTAQNAAPLAFKMAIDANFPQLGAVLDKFQNMAQMMNDTNMSSCQMARGLMDNVKMPSSDILKDLSSSVNAGLGTALAWTDDYSKGIEKFKTNPTAELKKVQAVVLSDGSTAAPAEIAGNQTWEQLIKKANKGMTFQFADDPNMTMQLLMSLIGTRAYLPGSTDEAEPKLENFVPTLTLANLFRPPLDSNGKRSVLIHKCSGGDYLKCKEITTGERFITTGLIGHIKSKMYGASLNDESDTEVKDGSILGNIINCTSQQCGLTTTQISFLNSFGKIPAVGLLIKAQKYPSIMKGIALPLVNEMVIEMSQVYGQAILDIAVTAYSKSDVRKPDGYDAAIASMRVTIEGLDKEANESMGRMNIIATNIDNSIRANAAIATLGIR